ncbi:hypothetical protein LLH03_08925 [bacterium]|nr:hypothetical protein [bacterium]
MCDLRSQAQPYLDFVCREYGHKDRAHDFHHIERIVSRLPMLSEGLSPQWDRLYFLACFHGLHARIQNEEAFRERVEAFLGSLGWQDTADLLASLARHLRAPVTVEEQIVHDANYLQLLGAFGVAKAFLTGGALGQSFEETADIFEHQYLDRVEFLTPVGRRMAADSRAYTKDFLRRLREEW